MKIRSKKRNLLDQLIVVVAAKRSNIRALEGSAWSVFLDCTFAFPHNGFAFPGDTFAFPFWLCNPPPPLDWISAEIQPRVANHPIKYRMVPYLETKIVPYRTDRDPSMWGIFQNVTGKSTGMAGKRLPAQCSRRDDWVAEASKRKKSREGTQKLLQENAKAQTQNIYQCDPSSAP